MIVSAILKGKGSAVITAEPTENLLAISNLIAKHRIGAVIISERGGPPLGILSERDIVNAVRVPTAVARSVYRRRSVTHRRVSATIIAAQDGARSASSLWPAMRAQSHSSV